MPGPTIRDSLMLASAAGAATLAVKAHGEAATGGRRRRGGGEGAVVQHGGIGLLSAGGRSAVTQDSDIARGLHRGMTTARDDEQAIAAQRAS